MRIKIMIMFVFVMGFSTLVLAQEPPIDIGQKQPYNAMTTFVPKPGAEKSLKLVLKYTKGYGSNTQGYALDRKIRVRYNKDELENWRWCTYVGSVFDQQCEPDKPLKADATITVP
jgi:hypothetical protein